MIQSMAISCLKILDNYDNFSKSEPGISNVWVLLSCVKRQCHCNELYDCAMARRDGRKVAAIDRRQRAVGSGRCQLVPEGRDVATDRCGRRSVGSGLLHHVRICHPAFVTCVTSAKPVRRCFHPRQFAR